MHLGLQVTLGLGLNWEAELCLRLWALGVVPLLLRGWAVGAVCSTLSGHLDNLTVHDNPRHCAVIEQVNEALPT